MSHHVAELIRRADTAATADEREKAAMEATATILKIWEYRKVLPYDAYPLAPYEELLRLISRLSPDGLTYKFAPSRGATETDRLAAVLFDNLTRLILTLLFMKVDGLELWKIQDEAAIAALDQDEKQILQSISEWYALLPVEKNGSAPKKKRKKSVEPAFDLKDNAIRIIENLRSALDQLSSALKPEEKQ